VSAEGIARALGGARSGLGWICRCPVPDHGQGRGDRSPSLSLADGNEGKLLLKCWAGCDPLDVLAELRRHGLLDSEDGRFASPTAKTPISARSPPAATPKPDAAALSDAQRIVKGRRLWVIRRRLLGSSAAEAYLFMRDICLERWPPTLAYLPACGEHAHGLIAAIGLATEPEPGVLAIADDAVMAVHITKLAPNGLAKLNVNGQPNKITIGRPLGHPIVLAPIGDGLSLVIAEGIEDALSAHLATGLGAWAAGSAKLLPALGEIVPGWIDHVSILGHRDPAGIKGADQLAARLEARGIKCAVTFLEGHGT
jgi:putative DNA primase/helicase